MTSKFTHTNTQTHTYLNVNHVFPPMLQGKLDSHYHASHRQQFPQDVFSGTGCGLLQPLGICVCVCVSVSLRTCVCVCDCR